MWPSPLVITGPRLILVRHVAYNMVLQRTHLRQHLKLLPPLVKVDESVGQSVWYRCVYHSQICQERAQVRYRPMADVL